MSSFLSPKKKPRKVIKDSQKKALRDWYNDDSNEKQFFRSSSRWWEEQYDYALNIFTLSEIFSQKWAHLDEKLVLV